MNFKTILFSVVVAFVAFCGVLVLRSAVSARGLLWGGKCILLQQPAGGEQEPGQTVEANEPRAELTVPASFTALGGEPQAVRLGSLDPNSGFEFEVELTTRGAAIRKATFSRFDDRNYKNPQPLEILSPVELAGGGELLSLANEQFVFVPERLQLPLQELHWRSLGSHTEPDGSQIAAFEAVLKDDASGQPVIKLTKTYKVSLGTYLLHSCSTASWLSRISHSPSGRFGSTWQAPWDWAEKAAGAICETLLVLS